LKVKKFMQQQQGNNGKYKLTKLMGWLQKKAVEEQREKKDGPAKKKQRQGGREGRREGGREGGREGIAK